MKRIFLPLMALVGAASLAPGALIWNEPFDYPDGSLILVSGGVWTNHSGAPEQVDVASGKVNLTQSEAEDVSAGLPGGPYSGEGVLFASFVVNFSMPPVGTGGYFWHYRDTGTTMFRARVFAVPNGSTYRVGIANGGNAPVVIPTDLDLNTDVKLVVRIINGTNSTLWINPTSEASSANRADANDNTSAVPLHSVCLRQSLSSGNGMGTLTLDDLRIGTTFADVQTIGGPPSISGLVDVHLPWNTATEPLAFLVSDVETPAGDLVVTATSDNPALVPNNPANLTFGGAGENRTLTVTPATGQQGLAQIEVVVTDGNNETATNSFKVYVGEPAISALANQFGPTNTVIGPLAFTVTDVETPGSLVVTPTSSNEAVIPSSNIKVQGSGANRTVTITPQPDMAGTATITLTVSDGTWDIPTSFKVTFHPKFGLVLDEDFSYDDGSIIENSFNRWFTHSAGTGATGQTQVVEGRLHLKAGDSEDISRGFSNFYQPVDNGIVLYSAFKVNLATLPTGNNGNYFAHYRDIGTGFRARVFAATNGAAPGKFRFHISNGGFVLAGVPQDLELNTTYLVLTRYNVDTAESTLWVNPTAEAVGGVTAVDNTTPITLYWYSFRQADGPSTPTLWVDDLKIGSQWSDVWEPSTPAAEALVATYAAGQLTLSWGNPVFILEAAPTVNGPFTEVPEASNTGYTVSPSDSQRYFRLFWSPAP
ncbi:MAG TPA: hypothetical protein PLT00_06060 [Verrucomicrobiota bacterium]|nr:hypothetical protein [Verrucomicrobiota bacterium]HQB16262.1 hypothetical protein [Verrucomicrobiota bacterium]